jgi:hypothetical protein
MMVNTDLTAIKQIPILEVASRLGIEVRGRRAMCFNGHDNRTPSLCFSAKNTWKCYGACSKGGDVISLVREMLGLEFVGALNWFALEFDVNIGGHKSARLHSRSRLARIRRKQPFKPAPLEVSKTDEFVADPDVYTWLIERCGRVSSPQGLAYLNDHGIAVDVANRFGVRELRDPVRALDAMITRWGAPRA